MDQLNDEELGKLLRLKKFEQPPAEYFESFLHEFHRRQRDELLRQPVWRIALQRAQDFMFRLNVTSLGSYPAAVAAVLVCAAVLSVKVYQTPETAAVASAAMQTPAAVVASPLNDDATWSLSAAPSTRYYGASLAHNVKQNSRTHRTTAVPPRYVLDSTPVSYDAALRF